ncbi:MAG TPA: hypothetical protein DCG49_09190, partial [Ruminococcus sp.]|nr:hypothetical protein [Ruminococcus sp.]
MRTFKRIAAVMQVFIILSTVVLHALPVSADEAKQFYQTVTAALFTDASYSAPLLSETEITLTGKMPKGASVKGYPVSYEIDGMKTIAAYDLTIFESDGETVFQPDHQTVNVTCAIPALADTVPDEIAVFHIDDNGNQTEIADISADSKTVSFAAEHFSVYVISEHEGEEAIVPRVEFHFLSDEFEKPDENYYSASAYPFYNKANELQTSQILRDGESLALIADPPNHVENGVKSYFYGWYVVNEDRDATTDETVYYRWTADPAKIPFEAPASVSYNQQEQTVTCTLGEYTATLPADADGCAHVYLAPLYSDYYFINFYNKDDDSNSILSLITSKLIAFGSDGEARARIGNITAPSPDIKHKVFVGWKRELPPTAQYDPNDPNIYIDSANNTVYAYYITLDTEGNEIHEPSGLDGYYIDCRLNEVDEHNNISLYPIFAEARWILFQHEPGSTYIGSRYILTNDEGAGTSFTSFPVSNKVGYDFNGWFTADGTRITDGNGVLVDHLPMTDEMYQIENGVMTAKKLPDESANSDITLYPRWTVKNNTNYTVNIWLQKSTDAADAAEKTYDYLESHPLTSATGATLAQLLNDNTENGVKQFTNLHYTGFHFEPSASKMERAVTDPSTGEPGLSSDGQTVINLYYDRNVHNLYFQAYLSVTEYTPTTSNKGTQYGYYEGEYVPIYYINKTWYRTRTGSYGNYQYRDKYTGTRYIASTSDQWTTIKTITEIYEHHIADNFPITGSNGVTYGNGERWKAQSVYDEVLVRLETMPDADVTFRLDTAQRPLKTMNYYVECLPGETGDITFEGKAYQLYQSIGARYNMVTETEDFSPIEGFTQYKADPPFVNGIAIYDTSRDGTINMYYTRDNGKLLFIPNYPTLDSDLSFGGVPFKDLPDDSDVLLHSPIEKSVKYQASLLNYAEGSPDYVDISDKAPDNYVFSGWYLDSACLNPFDPDVQMPSGNLRLFAKWEPVKFRILIDPNGAEIDHINHAVSDYRTVIWGNGNFPEDSEPIPPFKPGSTYNTSHATYFDNNYHQAIEEYTLEPPQYITISDEYARQLPEDQVYYYLNMQYKESIDKQKIPRDLRNALYLTENELRDYYDHFYVPLIQAYKAANPDEYGDLQIVSFGVWKQNYVAPEKYTHINDVTNGEYAFEGWFEVFEDGSVAEMPFDFATLVTSPHKLEAHWKLNGGYTIVYTPLSFT